VLSGCPSALPSPWKSSSPAPHPPVISSFWVWSVCHVKSKVLTCTMF
jgi:hypothetical protein